MIFEYPKLEPADQDVLGMIREQRRSLRHLVNANPVRWTGFLRRNTFARAIQGSNSIEGFNATLAEAVAIIDAERPENLGDETLRALECYRTAMSYVLGVHNDPYTRIDAQFIRSLHFMMLSYDTSKLPGQWRPGSIMVVRQPANEVVYEGPDASEVPGLMDELAGQINRGDAVDSATVLGAMAHLNLAMIHPFKDGNGRMARALQTLVIARNGIVSPELSSIEEWLGRNTQAYYAILGETGGGGWHPARGVLPWVRFCLVGHYQQAATLLKRNAQVGQVWTEIEAIRVRHGLPARCESALMDAAFGYAVRNGHYRAAEDISEVTASRDLKRLCDLRLLVAVGERRGRRYVAADALKAIMERGADHAMAPNPYDLARQRRP